MGIESARAHLDKWNRAGDILEFAESSATVELAAKALGTEEGRIAKTLSFMAAGRPILVVASGGARIDNRKYKAEFGRKAAMLSADELRDLVGHGAGGVCPFGLKPGVEVYLDRSLRAYDYVYPACGSSNSAIKLAPDELETISGAAGWVDVCTERSAAE